MTAPYDIFANKTIAVLGLGRSGHSAAQKLHQAGAKIMAWDDHNLPQNHKYPLVNLNETALEGIDLLLLSPGIDHDLPLVQRFKQAQIPLCCDVELFLQAHSQHKIIAITGTNGKSTTTSLCAHLLKSLGIPHAMGGNIGIPAFALETVSKQGVYVLELSSYQLELMQSKAIDRAVILNITPDHLDRHKTLTNYINAKERILEPLLRGQAYLFTPDPLLDQLAQRHPKAIQLNLDKPQGGMQPYFEGGKLIDPSISLQPLFDLSQHDHLRGAHSLQNALAAYVLCKDIAVQAGFTPAQLCEGFASFHALEHRQQLVAQKQGLLFVNDSKATNAQATLPALKAYQNIFWILGGVAKPEGIDPLLDQLENVRAAYLIGQNSDKFQAQLSPKVPVSQLHQLDLALRAAFKDALSYAQEHKQDCCVLLSPACASFDQFENFEKRGHAFETLVKSLLKA